MNMTFVGSSFYFLQKFLEVMIINSQPFALIDSPDKSYLYFYKVQMDRVMNMWLFPDLQLSKVICTE